MSQPGPLTYGNSRVLKIDYKRECPTQTYAKSGRMTRDREHRFRIVSFPDLEPEKLGS